MAPFVRLLSISHRLILVTRSCTYGIRANHHHHQRFFCAAADNTISQGGRSLPDKNKCIYLDYNGTTPIDKRVVEAMMPFFTQHWGNPSSSHYYGQQPKQAIAKARKSMLSLLYSKDTNAKHEDGIVFTGCGTEADNLAIHLALEAYRNSQDTGTSSSTTPHIVTSNVEHPAIEQYLKALQEDDKVTVTYVPVNNQGTVSADDMIQAIDKHENAIALVTLMLANNESGALQPVKQVADYCRSKGILFHTDAAQAVGKVSISMDDNNDNTSHGIGSNVDMVTIVGHKFGAPKGIACLYIRPDCFATESEMNYMLLGGGQEGGKRGGTENVPYIVGMGAAADIAMAKANGNHLFQWQQNAQWMETMRSRLYERLLTRLDGITTVRDNGPSDHKDRLPNTLSVGLKGVNSGALLQRIQHQVACSAGAACHSIPDGGEDGDESNVSSVLRAMAVPMEYARGTLRLSLGPGTTPEEIDKAGDIIAEEVKRQLAL